jgi:formate-dependent nitrite reductase membrane component NrfD
MDTDTDLLLTIGIVLLVLSIPSLLSAWAESRAPRIGAIMVIAALGLIIAALVIKPGGYAFNQVPGIMIGVVARLFE